MVNFEAMLESVSKRPAMYVGTCSIWAVRHYLDGYCHALGNLGDGEDPFDGWSRWVELRFLIRSSAWGWPRILLHAYGSDQAAIEALPSLYKEFCVHRSAMGVEWIDAELRKRLFEQYGQDWYAPQMTETEPLSYEFRSWDELWPVSEALEIVQSRTNEDWSDAVSWLLERMHPNGAIPEPHIVLASAQYLLFKQRHVDAVREKLSAMVQRELGEASLLALEFLPDLAVPLFRRALRSRFPVDRMTAVAALVIIDQPWSRAELLAALHESTEQEATAECRAALSVLPHAILRQSVEQWEALNPHKEGSGRFLSLTDVFLKTRVARLQHEMDRLRARVLPLRSRYAGMTVGDQQVDT